MRTIFGGVNLHTTPVPNVYRDGRRGRDFSHNRGTATTAYQLAAILVLENKRDEAFEHAQFDVAHGLSPTMRDSIENDPDLKSLRGDSRFATLVGSARRRREKMSPGQVLIINPQHLDPALQAHQKVADAPATATLAGDRSFRALDTVLLVCGIRLLTDAAVLRISIGAEPERPSDTAQSIRTNSGLGLTNGRP